MHGPPMVSRPAVCMGTLLTPQGHREVVLSTQQPSASHIRGLPRPANGRSRPFASGGFRRQQCRMTNFTTRASTYVVQDGDTLSSIAIKHNVPLKELRALNEGVLQGPKKKDIKSGNGRVLKSKDIIYVGEKLTLPMNASRVAQVDARGSLLPSVPSFSAPFALMAGSGALLVAAVSYALYQRHPMAAFNNSQEASGAATMSVDPVLQELTSGSNRDLDAAISRAKNVESFATRSFDEDEYKEIEKDKEGGLLGTLGSAVQRSQVAMAGAAGLLLGTAGIGKAKEGEEAVAAEGAKEEAKGAGPESGGEAKEVESVSPKEQDSIWASMMGALQPKAEEAKEVAEEKATETVAEVAKAVEEEVPAVAAEGEKVKEEEEKTGLLGSVMRMLSFDEGDKKAEEAKEEAEKAEKEAETAAEGEDKALLSTDPASSTDELSKMMGDGNPLWEGALSKLGSKEEKLSEEEPALDEKVKEEEEKTGLLGSVMRMLSFDEGDKKEEDAKKVEAAAKEEASVAEEEKAEDKALLSANPAASTDEMSRTMGKGNALFEDALSKFVEKAEVKEVAHKAEEMVQETVAAAEDTSVVQKAEDMVHETVAAAEDTSVVQKAEDMVQETVAETAGAATSAVQKAEEMVQETVAAAAGAATSVVQKAEETVQETVAAAAAAAAGAAAGAAGAEAAHAQPEPQGPFCAIRPEDAVWAAAVASAAPPAAAAKAKPSSESAEETVAEPKTGEENIAKISELREAAKGARDEMELTMWESAASIASGVVKDTKEVEEKVQSAKGKVVESLQALEDAIIKTSVEEASRASDVWAAASEDLKEISETVPDGFKDLTEPLPQALPEGRNLTGTAFVEAHTWAAKARQVINPSGGASSGPSDEEGPVEAPPAVPSLFDLRKEPPIEQDSTEVVVGANGAAPPASMFTTKMALLDAIYGAGRGLDADNETRGAVEEALTQLEANNPHPTPSQAMAQLDGRWKLVYTTNSQALAVLRAFRNLPMVNVGDITQIIDGGNLSVENKVEVAIPFMMSLSAHAAFEVRTPHQMKVKFQRGKMDTRITTPQLFENIEVPNEVTVMGRQVDLAPVQAIISPVNSALQTAGRTVRSVVAPEVEIEIPSFLLITYLDANLRVSRDDNGGVFVMVKDVPFDTTLMNDE